MDGQLTRQGLRKALEHLVTFSSGSASCVWLAVRDPVPILMLMRSVSNPNQSLILHRKQKQKQKQRWRGL